MPETIVIVDDDQVLRHVFARALARAGYSVLETTGTPEVPALIDAHRPGLVLLDNHMPGTNGLDLIAAIRATHPREDLPLVLISGSSDVREIQRALDLGATDFRRKPVEIPELMSLVREFMPSDRANRI